MAARDTRKSQNYQRYDFDIEHEYRSGLVVVPLGSEPGDGFPATEVVRLHAPYTRRRATFDAEKKGSPPVVPGPFNPDNENDVFLGGRVAAAVPKVSADGVSYNWHVWGLYDFVQSEGWEPGEDMPVGRYPYLTPMEDQSFASAAQASGVPPPTPLPDPDNAAAVAAYFANPFYVFVGGFVPACYFDPSLLPSG